MKIQYSNKLADRIAYIECQINTLPFVDCDCCPEEPELVSVSFDYERGAFVVA